jgi:hypothetical protein
VNLTSESECIRLAQTGALLCLVDKFFRSSKGRNVVYQLNTPNDFRIPGCGTV